MMNHDFFKYKKNFLTVVLILGYVYLHCMLTGLPEGMPFSDWVTFKVELPFAQRLMIPSLIRGLQFLLPDFLRVKVWFFCFEIVFVSLLFAAFFVLLKKAFSKDQALFLCWLFFLIFPLVNIINYRYTFSGEGTFYTHYDIPALFFCVIGFYLCLESRWVLFCGCVFLATFNRESAVLLVFLVPVLHAHRIKTVLKPTLYALFSFLLAKLILYWILWGHSGFWAELIDIRHGVTNFELNSRWLFAEQHNMLALIFGTAGLPIFWFVFYDFIPHQFRLLRYPLFAYFIGLLFVGKFSEPRIFGEIVVFLYYPVCLAVRNYFLDVEPVAVGSTLGREERAVTKILYYCDRYIIMLVMFMLVLSSSFIISYLDKMLGLK